MLSRQSASRPRLAAHRRNRGHDRLPSEDGQARGAKAVSPTQPRDRVLPRLDQKQTGTAPIPPARLGQSANGNALGLPHLQPATVDPTAQAASRIRRRLKPQRRDRSREASYANQTTLPLSHLQPSRSFWGMGSGFFTASKREKWRTPGIDTAPVVDLTCFGRCWSSAQSWFSTPRLAPWPWRSGPDSFVFLPVRAATVHTCRPE